MKWRSVLQQIGGTSKKLGVGAYHGGEKLRKSIDQMRLDEQVRSTTSFLNTLNHIEGMKKLSQGTVDLEALNGAELHLKPNVKSTKTLPSKIQVVAVGAKGVPLVTSKVWPRGERNLNLPIQDIANFYEVQGKFVKDIGRVMKSRDLANKLNGMEGKAFMDEYSLVAGQRNKEDIKPIEQALKTLESAKWKNTETGALARSMKFELFSQEQSPSSQPHKINLRKPKKNLTQDDRLELRVGFKEGANEFNLSLSEFTKQYTLSGI